MQCETSKRKHDTFGKSQSDEPPPKKLAFPEGSEKLNVQQALRTPQFWGPYLAERQWATVREDNSCDGNCWEYFSHDEAHSRVYRWGEDGLLGICDVGANLCSAPAMWNGHDPILKERLFGLTGPQGCHGEDVKELYYYLDNTVNHTYMKALYKYTLTEFPYQQLIDENNKRMLEDPEFEIIDTGVFDDGYWDIFVEYAKDTADSLLCRYSVWNRSQKEAVLTILPQFWFRNVWSWPTSDKSQLKPVFRQVSSKCVEAVFKEGTFVIDFHNHDDTSSELIFTENEDTSTIAKTSMSCSYLKDAFHKYIVKGDKSAVRKGENVRSINIQHGTKCAAVYKLVVPPGGMKQVKWSLYPASVAHKCPSDIKFEEIFTQRIAEANNMYDDLFPASRESEEWNVVKQAYAGLLWNKQFYCYNVDLWIKDKPKNMKAEEESFNIAFLFEQDKSCDREVEKEPKIQNKDWKHMVCHDIISMPDKWEFPWYATWDLAFHMLPFVRIDPQFAMDQLLLLLSDKYMHPNGQLPAYEFDFSDVNPPVHAWACLKVFRITKDVTFLRKCLHRLLINFTWWINTKETGEKNLFTGGFLGMDNISVLDRSKIPDSIEIRQADATGWMAFYSLCMLEMCVELGQHDVVYGDMAVKFVRHFLSTVTAMNKSIRNGGLWHDTDRFYYDVLIRERKSTPICVRSMVGLVPLFATTHLTFDSMAGLDDLILKLNEEILNNSEYILRCKNGILFTAVPIARQKHLMARVFDEKEFLSPFGIRSLSKFYKKNPYIFTHNKTTTSLTYAPGDSDSCLFGGNSNWRGPIWLCMNFLLTESLEIYGKFLDEPHITEFPSLREMAKDISQRIVSIFMPRHGGHRPLHGNVEKYASVRHWKDLILFYEYFHGDTGKGCGASHQTGWCSLVIEFVHKLKEYSYPISPEQINVSP